MPVSNSRHLGALFSVPVLVRDRLTCRDIKHMRHAEPEFWPTHYAEIYVTCTSNFLLSRDILWFSQHLLPVSLTQFIIAAKIRQLIVLIDRLLVYVEMQTTAGRPHAYPNWSRLHPSADEMTSQNDLMSDPSADGYFKILYYVWSRLRTICPCLDQGPIRHKDGPPTNLVNTVMIFSFIPTNTWSLVHIDVGIAATSRRNGSYGWYRL